MAHAGSALKKRGGNTSVTEQLLLDDKQKILWEQQCTPAASPPAAAREVELNPEKEGKQLLSVPKFQGTGKDNSQVMSVGQRWGNRVCWQDSINSTITIPGEMPPSFWLSRSALKSHCPWLLKAACFSSYLLNFCPIFILDWLFATPGMNIATLIPGWAGIYVGNAERWVRSQAVREKLSSKGMFK